MVCEHKHAEHTATKPGLKCSVFVVYLHDWVARHDGAAEENSALIWLVKECTAS